MHWIVASLVSAVFLGCYEVFTKQAVRNNAVLPVLFFSTLCSATVWTVLMALQALDPAPCRRPSSSPPQPRFNTRNCCSSH